MGLLTIPSPSSPLSPRLLTAKTHSPNLILPQPTSTISFSVRSQNSQSDSNPATPTADEKPRKPPTSGVGFGSPVVDASPAKPSSTGKKRGKRERATVIRRTPVEKPAFLPQVDEKKVEEEKGNESAFLLTWLGLGGVILVEGIALAASGFLPEEWDKFFVKYLYPSFTPTVALFVAGTVAYGVSKYLQNEKLKDRK
ncbi:hypothetical protein MLD38_008950 [Melastoma candidum]|uniref:Uncharacterized protein n=1 Tax=Melastoma candidum TaxID=119954 RepID=A0ACB9RVF3_9MYRT|nr:hypothetical protein MLD38_008950 [Melastoma candidum]